MTQKSDYIAISPDHLLFDDIALLEKYGNQIDNILRKYQKLFDYQAKGWPVGLEIKLARKLNSKNIAFFEQNGKYLYADHDGNPAPFNKFESRVPSELGAHYAWTQNSTGNDAASILRLNQILTNSKDSRLRTGDIFTTCDIHGVRLKYLQYDSLEIELDRFFQNQRFGFNPTHQFIISISKFVRFLAIHPFADGNGRVSRVLFQVWLHSAGLLKMPMLPLGPIMSVRSREFVVIFRRWILEKNTRFVFDFMIECIDETASLITSLVLNDCKK